MRVSSLRCPNSEKCIFDETYTANFRMKWVPQQEKFVLFLYLKGKFT